MNKLYYLSFFDKNKLYYQQSLC